MFSRISRTDLVRMMNGVFFSPMLYAVAAWILSRYPLKTAVDIHLVTSACLSGCVALIIISRPLRWLLLPPGMQHATGRIVMACFVLSTIGELMAMSGAAVVWLGARLQTYIPFLIVSGLYYLDFRVFRFPAIMSRWPKDT